MEIKLTKHEAELLNMLCTAHIFDSDPTVSEMSRRIYDFAVALRERIRGNEELSTLELEPQVRQ